MIDMPTVLAELVHNKAQISDMVNRYDIGVAYPYSDVLKLFQLLMGSEDNKFCFFFIDCDLVLGLPSLEVDAVGLSAIRHFTIH